MRKNVAVLLFAAVLLGLCLPAQAAALETQEKIILDAAALRPEDGVWALGGNLVYFGQYQGAPVVFRVLSSPGADDEDKLLLDCDSTLLWMAYDDNFRKNEGQSKLPSEWKGSDIEVWLNSDAFYGSGEVFSTAERAAIARTRLEGKSPYTIGKWAYEDYGSTDYVYLLSAAEANQLYGENAARAKDGSSTSWWLRSAFGSGGNGAASVHGDGHICNNSISILGVGVSPALQVKLSSILFASAMEAEQDRMVWKLTLLDAGKTVNIPDGKAVRRADTEAGCLITIPYTYAGENVNQISVMITDGGQVLYYGTLRTVVEHDGTGIGLFVLPSDLENQTCGVDYYGYILAEDVNGAQQTDYASALREIAIPTRNAPLA